MRYVKILSTIYLRHDISNYVLKHEEEAYEHAFPYTCLCCLQISQELQKTASK